MGEPTESNFFQKAHIDLLCENFRRYMGKELIDCEMQDRAQSLYKAPI